MGDSDESKGAGGVPSWQIIPSAIQQDGKTESHDTAPQSVQSRASILESARKFLLDDEVRDAPTDKQIAFLESKGLEKDEIQQILGVTRNTEATNPTTEPIATSKPTAMKSPYAPSPAPTSLPGTQISRDLPPIITYPEFLTTPQQPAPLVTARRLLATLYLFGGLSALIYGTNKYLITPMVKALTSSRHEFAENVQENLDKLIAKLDGMVSETPEMPSSVQEEGTGYDGSDSDPSELFHRDIGVQTSLPPSPSNSRPSSPALAIDSLTTQTNKLQRVTELVEELNQTSISEGERVSRLSTTISDLRDYLDSLMNVAPAYNYSSGNSYSTLSQKNENANDAITKVKAQIRGVKGVLLGTRTFPAGTWQGRVR